MLVLILQSQDDSVGKFTVGGAKTEVLAKTKQLRSIVIIVLKFLICRTISICGLLISIITHAYLRSAYSYI